MTNYLIVGDGRLARHLTHYFRALDLSVQTWSRKKNTPEELQTFSKAADRILLLISDGQIESFVRQYEFLLSRRLIHCSGAQSFSFAASAHPLNTFGPELYDLQTYVETPFVIEKGGADFAEILPGLPNPHHVLPREKKALYHALCVASGNFTTLLWQNVGEAFARDLKLPKEILETFLKTTVRNLIETNGSALTGPIARGDVSTIVRNLDSLRGRPEQALYYAFLNYVQEKKNFAAGGAHERLGL